MAAELHVLHRPAALDVDRRAMKVSVYGEWRPMSLGRYRLLCYLLDHEGEMVPHEVIFRVASGYDYPSPQTNREQLASNSRHLIARLRRHIGDAVRFESMPGVGFRMEVERHRNEVARLRAYQMPNPDPDAAPGSRGKEAVMPVPDSFPTRWATSSHRLGSSTYQGRIYLFERAGRITGTWMCDHEHATEAEARECAKRNIDAKLRPVRP